MNWDKHGINVSKVVGNKGFCPQCHEGRKNKSDRSLSVDLQTGLFNCHHCDFKGTAAEFERPERAPRIYQRPKPKVKPPESKMIQWFGKRGISPETLTKAGVFEANEWMPQPNAERTCICFPYFRDGEIINVKYRDAQKNFKLSKGAELIFFGLDSLKQYPEKVIITEGEIDALTLIEVGVGVAVLSVPNGAAKGGKLEYLDNCWESFEGVKEIMVATDGDAPGIALRDELCRRLGPERCFYVTYPEGTKDLNEVFLKHQKAGIIDVLKNAKEFPLDGWETADDVYGETDDIRLNGYDEGLRSGWLDFDEHLRFSAGGLTVITGIPSHGKSTWLNNLLIRMAREHSWRAGLFTPEMQPSKVLMAQLVELTTGQKIRGMDKNVFDGAMAWLSDQFWIMKVDDYDLTIDSILKRAAELVKRKGINALVIDPWNYVVHDRGQQSETDYISEALTKVKQFKSKYGVHVFIVAHPTKIPKINGAYSVPTLYDIAGSANWRNKADNGVVVFRNLERSVTEIHVQKIRWWFEGNTGVVDMHYNKDTRQFAEYSTQFPAQ